jgi:hypothetical protein
MTNETKQAEIENAESWIFEPLETDSEISSMGHYDPDFDDCFADLDEPLQVETASDWIVSESSDLAQSVAADPTVLRTLLSELSHLAPHLPGMLRQQVADAVAHHGLAAHWLDYVDAHVA